MELVYLPSTVSDLEWFRTYYSDAFPNGQKQAQKQFIAIEQILRDNPHIGHKTEFNNVRELVISKTPFSIIYRLTPDRIEILRIWDNRANPSRLEF